MGEPKASTSAIQLQNPASSPLPSPPVSLVPPDHKKKRRSIKSFRIFRSLFRSFPIFTPICKFPILPKSLPDPNRNVTAGSCVTGTLFGYRKGKVTLSIQDNPRCFPTLVMELAMQTNVLQKELSSGLVRIALETEKRSEKDKMKLLEEPLWTMYCNGKKTGYGVKRDASEEDLNIMELLKAVSMGAGVLPGKSDIEGPEGEIAYIRAHFERVVGSKDSQTLYMMSPEGNNGPELSIFLVRV